MSKEYFVTHGAGCIPCDSISREKEDGTFEELTYDDIVGKLNENQKLHELITLIAEAESFLLLRCRLLSLIRYMKKLRSSVCNTPLRRFALTLVLTEPFA